MITIDEIKQLDANRNDRTWQWDGRKVDEDDGYIYHPQGSYLGSTLITLGDTYEDDHHDLDFIAAAPKIAAKCIELDAVNRELITKLQAIYELLPTDDFTDSRLTLLRMTVISTLIHVGAL